MIVDEVKKPPFLVRRRTTFTWVAPLALFIAAIYFHSNIGGVSAYAAGVTFVVLGEIVRFWAAGYIAKDSVIATGGPYAHVRNPLYFGSFLLALGYGAASGLGWWGIGSTVALFLLFHLAAIWYEESFLKSRFGAAYKEYMRRVPRLLPSPWPRTEGSGHFEWQQAIRNREHLSALFAVIYLALLSLRYLVHYPR